MINREIMVEMDEVIDSVISEINNGGTVTMVGGGKSMAPFIESGTDKIVLSKIPTEDIIETYYLDKYIGIKSIEFLSYERVYY